MDSTIVAFSSAFPAAIAILRLSGSNALSLLNSCFFSKERAEHKKMRVGLIDTKTVKDKAAAVFFKAPDSFTGEDTAEIYIHGSKALAHELLDFLIKSGATPAQKGEFTKRAFLNGKMDLSKAEGVINIINAETRVQAQAAFNLLSGSVKNRAQEIQDKIKGALAAVEVSIDYPEEDLEQETLKSLCGQIKEIKKEVLQLKNTFNTGKFIKDGVKIAVIGGVNVGKSSLINALLNKERALVTDIAGTTRDLIEDSYQYNGYKFIILDTAGIRQTKNKIEKLGIQKSKLAAEESDIILAVCCAGEGIDNQVSAVINKKQDGVIYVENKIDVLTPKIKSSVKVSALKGINIDGLKQQIYNKAALSGVNGGQVIITELRHFNALVKTEQALSHGLDNLYSFSMDCIAADLQNAFNLLGEITGINGSEEIINHIFESFCVGK